MKISLPALFFIAAIFCFAAYAEEFSNFAVELVDYSGDFGPSPYDDPCSVIGSPTTDFNDIFYFWSGGDKERVIKMVEPAYNVDLDGNKVITTLQPPGYTEPGDYIIVKFDHKVVDYPDNLYGKDFIVFGNSFYVGGGTEGGWVNDETDMSMYYLAGGVFAEPVLISVSQGPNYPEQPPSEWVWYTYENGPYGDEDFPTHAYEWDQDKYDTTGNGWTSKLMNFTKPVNPAYQEALFYGDESWVVNNTPYQVNYDGYLNVSEAIQLYEGSGGGTGFDLQDLEGCSGLATDSAGYRWIQYVKFEGFDAYEGEIDAVSDVTACGDPSHPYPDGDVTKDCRVNFQDFAALAGFWLDEITGAEDPAIAADLEPDDIINAEDLLILVDTWLDCSWNCD